MRIVFAALIAALVSGCGALNVTSAFHVNPITKPYNSSASDRGYEYTLTRDPFDLDKDCLPGLGGTLDGDRLVCSQSAVEAIVSLARITAPPDSKIQLAEIPRTSEPAGAKAIKNPVFQSRLGRNRLQDHLIAQSNDVCDIQKAAMFGKITTANLAFDFATIGLATASTLVTGGASDILAGAASATAGGRAALNENLVQNLLVTAITESIDGERTNRLTDIRVRQSDNLDTYSIEAAIGDALLYHEQCSLYAGLEKLRQQADKIKTTREEYLDRARKLIEFAQTLPGKGGDGAGGAAPNAGGSKKDDPKEIVMNQANKLLEAAGKTTAQSE